MNGRPRRLVVDRVGAGRNNNRRRFTRYVVVKGNEPGVYRQWELCKQACGNRNGAVWGGFYDKDDADKCYMMIRKVLLRQQPLLAPTIIEQQDPRDFWRNKLTEVERTLSAYPALAAGEIAFVDSIHLNRDDQGRFVIYTHGAYFPSPDNTSGKAAAGIWFGHQSQLNSTLTYTNTFRCSKNDADLVATLFALKTAKSAGMESVCIHSQFKFVSGRVTDNKFGGASHVLLDSLRTAIRDIPNVSWVVCSSQEHGAMEVKSLAQNRQ